MTRPLASFARPLASRALPARTPTPTIQTLKPQSNTHTPRAINDDSCVVHALRDGCRPPTRAREARPRSPWASRSPSFSSASSPKRRCAFSWCVALVSTRRRDRDIATIIVSNAMDGIVARSRSGDGDDAREASTREESRSMRAESFFASNASSARRERASRGGHARDETRWIIASDECQPRAPSRGRGRARAKDGCTRGVRLDERGMSD